MGWAGEGEPGSTGSLRVAWALRHTQGQGGSRAFPMKGFLLRRWVGLLHEGVSSLGDHTSYVGEKGPTPISSCSHPACGVQGFSRLLGGAEWAQSQGQTPRALS